MSAITILGTPGEVYSFGTVYIWLVTSYPLAIWFSAHVFLPVFHRLQITSVYEVSGMGNTGAPFPDRVNISK